MTKMSSLADIVDNSGDIEQIQTLESKTDESESSSHKQIDSPPGPSNLDKPSKVKKSQEIVTQDESTPNTSKKRATKSNPRRVEQNRLAQRAFRMRKDAYIKRLEEENTQLQSQVSQFKNSMGNIGMVNEYKIRCNELEQVIQKYQTEKDIWIQEKLSLQRQLLDLQNTMFHTNVKPSKVEEPEEIPSAPILISIRKGTNEEGIDKEIRIAPQSQLPRIGYPQENSSRSPDPSFSRIQAFGLGPSYPVPFAGPYPPYPPANPYMNPALPHEYNAYYPPYYRPYFLPHPRKKE